MAMKRKVDTPGALDLGRRIATVELVFGNVQNKGMRRFTLRGRKELRVATIMAGGVLPDATWFFYKLIGRQDPATRQHGLMMGCVDGTARRMRCAPLDARMTRGRDGHSAPGTGRKTEAAATLSEAHFTGVGSMIACDSTPTVGSSRPEIVAETREASRSFVENGRFLRGGASHQGLEAALRCSTCREEIRDKTSLS